MFRFLMLALVWVAVPFAAAAESPVIDLGRQLTAMFYQGRCAEIWPRMSEEMHDALVSLDDFNLFYAQIGEQLGEETQRVAERELEHEGVRVYLRTARFEKTEQLMEILWAFDAANIVVGFFVRPVQSPAPTEFLEYETKTTLSLPFAGEWYIFWGGRTLEDNYHVVAVDQRFACDIMVRKDGLYHSGDGLVNEDYYCFGLPLRSPGAGVVVAVENDVVDNVPGELNPRQPLGNHVVIDHGNGEYSFLAHFQKGSVAVAVGQVLQAGDSLGKCGNSGNTTAPHLHYHLQNAPGFQKGAGLPAFFQNYVADGKRVARGEPLKGQIVAPSSGD